MKPKLLLRSFGHRNFRLFFAGQSISLVGTWMQQVALAWLVFLVTHSPWWLGLVGFAGQIPGFLLAPLAGVLVDRWNRQHLLLATQGLAMGQAFLLAWLTNTGAITIGLIVLLSIFLGLVSTFDMTGRQVFLTEMVEDRADLANAIALNSLMVNGARMVGPALAGLLLARMGAGFCFLANGVSYLAVLAALLGMRIPVRQRPLVPVPLLHDLRDGFRYTFGFGPIRSLLLLLGLVSLVGMAYLTLLPVFATDQLGGGAETMGILSAAAGVGALSAGVLLASRQSILGLGKWIAWTPAVLGLALLGFSWSRSLWLSAILLVGAGAMMMVQLAATNTVLQTIVEEDKRGRVMSFYTMAFLGMAPLGSLLAGFLADVIGAPATVSLTGGGCILGAAIFARGLPALRAAVRPIYIRKGILPPLLNGLPGTVAPALAPSSFGEDQEAWHGNTEKDHDSAQHSLPGRTE